MASLRFAPSAPFGAERPRCVGLECPNCGWQDVRPALRSGLLDSLMAAILLSPYRCRKCRTRFFRLSIHKGRLSYF